MPVCSIAMPASMVMSACAQSNIVARANPRLADAEAASGLSLGKLWGGVRLLLWLALLCLSTFSMAQQSANYIYDELGRLKTVVAPNGDRAEYDYDAAGNLTAVRRIGTNTLAVSEFTPNLGASGTAVTIRGAGFSTTLANNSVKFNGVSATVTAATATQLTVTAPATGTTGPISVTVGASTVTTAESFTYVTGSTTGAPTITSFTPDNGAADTQVTVTGTNFDIAPGATKVELNGVAMPLVSVTLTQLVARVPAVVGSGKIRVVTPKGIASSANYFYVPPFGQVWADIVTKQAMTVGGTTLPVSLATAGKSALVLFDGTQNDYVTIQLSSYVHSAPSGSVSYTVFRPDNTVLSIAASVTSSSLSIHLPQLPTTGTYAIVFYPGPATASFSAKAVRDIEVVVGAAAIASSVDVAGQSVRHTIRVNSGANFGIGITNLVQTPSTALGASLNMYGPFGWSIGGISCYTDSTRGPGCSANLIELRPGVHSIVLKPDNSATATLSVQVNSDATGTLSPGTAASISLKSGQNARYTFSGVAGQSRAIEFSQLLTNPSGRPVDVYVFTPTDLITTTGGAYSGYWKTLRVTANGGTLNLPVLPVTGTYTVIVDTTSQETATFKLTLESGTALTVGAASATAGTVVSAGESARFTFNATAGQNLGIGIDALAITPNTVTYADVTVYQPDGTVIANVVCYTSSPGCSTNLNNLAAGTYAVVVQPPSGATATFTIQVNADVSGTLTAGVAATISLKCGQNARYTFNGTANQNVALEFAQITTNPSSRSLIAYVYRPTDTVSLNNGTFSGQWSSYTLASPGTTIKLPPLPAAGIYTVIVDTRLQETASLRMTLEPGIPVTIDGASASATIGNTGETAFFTFNGTAGQNLGLALTGLTLSPASSLYATTNIYLPDGTEVYPGGQCYPDGNGCARNLANLPVTGTYSIIVTFHQGGTGSVSVTLSSDLTGVLTAGTAVTANFTRPGQNARYTFSGTAGQQLGLTLSNGTSTPAGQSLSVILTDPNGSMLANVGMLAGSATPGVTDVPPLPVTGLYTVFVEPAGIATGSVQVLLSQDVSGTVVIDGAATAVSITQPGQTARLTFSGVAGQNLGLGMTGLALSPVTSTRASFSVYYPGSPFPTNSLCYTNGDRCSVNLPNLSPTGTYEIVVTPDQGSTGTFSLTLSNDLTGALALGTPATISLTRAGQNARYTFSGTSGQLLRLSVSALTTTPASQVAQYTIYAPGGAAMAAPTASTVPFAYDIAALPATGTYTILVEPYESAQGAATLSTTITVAPR